MAKEIERKFLVLDQTYKQYAEGVYYQQGYLASKPSVRVRIIDKEAFLTIKGAATGFSRSEYEYRIPYEDGLEMLHELCQKPIIEKYRYKVEYAGFIWEIDEFLGDNAGLVVAEIELNAETQLFDSPPWLGKEVSGDARYYNSNLTQHPYSQWSLER